MAQTSGLVNLVLYCQTGFPISDNPLNDNGHNWAHYAKRMSSKPGVENASQQQAAHAEQRPYYSIHTESVLENATI